MPDDRKREPRADEDKCPVCKGHGVVKKNGYKNGYSRTCLLCGGSGCVKKERRATKASAGI